MTPRIHACYDQPGLLNMDLHKCKILPCKHSILDLHLLHKVIGPFHNSQRNIRLEAIAISCFFYHKHSIETWWFASHSPTKSADPTRVGPADSGCLRPRRSHSASAAIPGCCPTSGWPWKPLRPRRSSVTAEETHLNTWPEVKRYSLCLLIADWQPS